MRIALVHPFHWNDVGRGGERYVADLARYLVGAGHEVTAIVGGQPSVVMEDGLRVVRVRHRLPERLRARGTSLTDAFGVAALPALRERFDVVHAMVPSVAVAARLCRQRVLFTALGHPTPDQFGARPLDLRLARAGFRAAHQVTAFSSPSAEAVREMFGCPCDVLPLGVRTADFPVRQGISTSPRLLFAGTPTEPRKGIDTVLKALPRLLEVHPDLRLVLTGEPWSWEGCSDRSAVDVIGPQAMDRMPALYRDVSVSVLPARQEALGIALVESLASGTPVVGGADGGILDVVTDPSIGRLAVPGNVASLVDAVLAALELAQDPLTAARCAAHAQAWDWDSALGPRHEAVYRSML